MPEEIKKKNKTVARNFDRSNSLTSANATNSETAIQKKLMSEWLCSGRKLNVSVLAMINKGRNAKNKNLAFLGARKTPTGKSIKLNPAFFHQYSKKLGVK